METDGSCMTVLDFICMRLVSQEYNNKSGCLLGLAKLEEERKGAEKCLHIAHQHMMRKSPAACMQSNDACDAHGLIALPSLSLFTKFASSIQYTEDTE